MFVTVLASYREGSARGFNFTLYKYQVHEPTRKRGTVTWGPSLSALIAIGRLRGPIPPVESLRLVSPGAVTDRVILFLFYLKNLRPFSHRHHCHPPAFPGDRLPSVLINSAAKKYSDFHIRMSCPGRCHPLGSPLVTLLHLALPREILAKWDITRDLIISNLWTWVQWNYLKFSSLSVENWITICVTSVDRPMCGEQSEPAMSACTRAERRMTPSVLIDCRRKLARVVCNEAAYP